MQKQKIEHPNTQLETIQESMTEKKQASFMTVYRRQEILIKQVK